jgi:pilus assembly protein Flp/PilA
MVNARYASQLHDLKPNLSGRLLTSRMTSTKPGMSPFRICARFLKDESAVTAVEYALIGGFIALAIIVSVSTLGTRLSIKYNAVASNLS